MGWKSIKQHYAIAHTVQVTSAGICIGSPYIHDIIVIGLDGTILNDGGHMGNPDLRRYMAEMKTDLPKLRDLAVSEDQFSASLPVYTYRGAEIVEKRCEELGWPNVTHDGEMMYENTFSPDREQVIDWAKRNCLASVQRWRDEVVPERLAKLGEAEAELARVLADAEALGVALAPA